MGERSTSITSTQVSNGTTIRTCKPNYHALELNDPQSLMQH